MLPTLPSCCIVLHSLLHTCTLHCIVLPAMLARGMRSYLRKSTSPATPSSFLPKACLHSAYSKACQVIKASPSHRLSHNVLIQLLGDGCRGEVRYFGGLGYCQQSSSQRISRRCCRATAGFTAIAAAPAGTAAASATVAAAVLANVVASSTWYAAVLAQPAGLLQAPAEYGQGGLVWRCRLPWCCSMQLSIHNEIKRSVQTSKRSFVDCTAVTSCKRASSRLVVCATLAVLPMFALFRTMQ